MAITYDDSLGLRIGAIIFIFFISLFGFFFPLYMKYKMGSNNLQENTYFLLLKSFASGTILSVALLHLLNDSINDLALYVEYPLGLALAMTGIIITLGLDQVTMFLMQKQPVPLDSVPASDVAVDKFETAPLSSSAVSSYQGSHDPVNNIHSEGSNEIREESEHQHSHPHSHPHSHSINKKSIAFEDTTSNFTDNSGTNKLELEVVGHHESHAHDHTHTHAMLMVTDKNAQKAFVKTMVLETSIAIHSIIIGVSFGGLGSDSITTIKVLFAAISFHQFFEGISLGSAISESNISFSIICFFALVFSLSFTTGAVIGIFTEGPNDTGIFVQGCFNAIAAGSLVYSALVEMIAEDFSSSETNGNIYLKFAMYCFLIFGCLGMAILAMYA